MAVTLQDLYGEKWQAFLHLRHTWIPFFPWDKCRNQSRGHMSHHHCTDIADCIHDQKYLGRILHEKKGENEGIKTIFSNSLSFQLSSYKQHVLVFCSQQLTALLIAYGAQQQQIDTCSTYMNYATITNISKLLRLIPLVGRYAWYFASSPSFSDELKGGRGERGVCWGSSRAKLLANLLLVGVA